MSIVRIYSMRRAVCGSSQKQMTLDHHRNNQPQDALEQTARNF
jgi:hypothetical protein